MVKTLKSLQTHSFIEIFKLLNTKGREKTKRQNKTKSQKKISSIYNLIRKLKLSIPNWDVGTIPRNTVLYLLTLPVLGLNKALRIISMKLSGEDSESGDDK